MTLHLPSTAQPSHHHHHHHHQSLRPPTIGVSVNSIDNISQTTPTTYLSQPEDNQHHRHHQQNMTHSTILAPTNRSRSTDEKGKRQGHEVIIQRKKKKCQDCEGDLVHTGDSTFQGLLMLNRHLSSYTFFPSCKERSREMMVVSGGGEGRGNGGEDLDVNGLDEHNLGNDDDDNEYACELCCRLVCTNCAVVDTDRRCLDCLYR